jgi:hypothetical protein
LKNVDNEQGEQSNQDSPSVLQKIILKRFECLHPYIFSILCPQTGI